MMELGEEDEQVVGPPSRLLGRLRNIPGYTWDESRTPFHSSYDKWHFFGFKTSTRFTKPGASFSRSKAELDRTAPNANPPIPKSQWQQNDATSTGASKEEDSSDTASEDSQQDGLEGVDVPVVAMVSTHALREERAYHICKNLSKTCDPEGIHIARPLDHFRLPAQQGDTAALVVSIFEALGPNALTKHMSFGPEWYRGGHSGGLDPNLHPQNGLLESISLPLFLDFAIGATECLELLHHGQRIIHGEIRGDAFHLQEESGKVKIINFGSGLRSFEHGLTSSGWATISKETDAKTKLSYISPEQTGRMPAEPDTRTDIYSLGILFWTLLTMQSAFDGETPMDIIQGVLGRRLPSVSSIRLDIPDVISNIISKMTAKAVSDRYLSVSGLRHDLVEVQKLLGDGNSADLENWKIATKDISSFFILPTVMIGRSEEHDEIVKIIDKVATARDLNSQRQGVYSLSSGSSLGLDADMSSETSSRSGGEKNSFAGILSSGERMASGVFNSNPSHIASTSSSQHNSQESVRSNSKLKPWERNNVSSLDTRNSMDADGDASKGSDGAGSLTSQRNHQKYHRAGRCEVISIDGAAGLGKSCLVQSVQVEARRRGYFASSKFDQAKRTAFGPVFKLLSSLFKQVFSESVTDTPFHQLLKQYVRPAWPMLHKVLNLPEFLLGPLPGPQRHSSNSGLQKSLSLHGRNPSSNYKGSGPNYARSASKYHRRDSSPTSSRNSFLSLGVGAQTSQDFLRAGSSTKSMRLMTTFLDVLRLFAHHKFICFCLDDLQFADDESLELISQIISSKIKMVIMITYRPDEILPKRIKQIIEPPDAEGIRNPKSRGVGVTRITLKPLSEEDITRFVSITMSRPMYDIIPLSAVVQAKSGGNPFYMREFISACHRKNCIWYGYKDGSWMYDMDEIFKQFSTDDYDVLNGDFVTRRLGELPLASRSILSWASLIGSSFSFELIQKLLNGEFDYAESDTSNVNGQSTWKPRSDLNKEAVAGLQAAIQAYVVVNTEDDDRFRFAHDRYLQAAVSLRTEDSKMHFIIAQTLLKYYASDQKAFALAADHICDSIDIINKRVTHRQSFRKVLFDCAQAAAESGARSTAVKLYSHCFSLLQNDPWDGEEDVYYDETLSLYLRAAECYLYMGEPEEATQLLSAVFQHGRTAVDKATAFVLQSRVFTQCGDSNAAFHCLKTSLVSLGLEIDEDPTWEKCDAEFERLTLKIQSTDRKELMTKRMKKNSNLSAVGAILVEITSTAYWSDPLIFFLMTNIFVNTHLTSGAFPQSGLSFLHLASVAISRFNMLAFGSEMGYISLDLMNMWQDPYTLGRGNTIYSLFVGHIQSSLPVSIGQLESALEFTIQAGDRISTILNFGVVALLKFFASEHMTDLESFCQYGPEEIPQWGVDLRGGVMLTAVRQVCWALQGKTLTDSALEVMSDANHDSNLYLAWIKESTVNSIRPIYIYESLEIAPLFLYGHYQRAVEKGRACIAIMEDAWSAQITRFLLFYYGLSIAGLVWNRIRDPRIQDDETLRADIDGTLAELAFVRKKLDDWCAVCDINYGAMVSMIDAQIAEIQGQHGSALHSYEKSLDHAAANSLTFEEALGNYLLAGFFVRHGARRPAKAALREGVMLFRQFGAVGVARYIEKEHSLLLNGPTPNIRSADVGVQVDFAGDSAPVQYQVVEGRQEARGTIMESKGDRIGAWQGGSARPHAGSGLPALDMLDLTSILEGSQVISSVLQVDQLLTTMVEIILLNCGAAATLAAIIVQEDDPMGLSIAASGNAEIGTKAHVPALPLTESLMVDNSVVLYCSRFRETVFLPDLVRDERFSNIDDSWWQRNPHGKSVIAIPITHGVKPLLGVLYLEGLPNAFTDRYLTVLQLLVNQIGISYSNALTLKAIEKVSASNISMVQSQKRALTKAKEAEIKAKLAEAEALRNVKLAEEAAKAKSIFLANVSHELRTPLNGVIGNSELLRLSDLTREQADMSDSIRISADLLLTVINDILDFSRMEAERMELFNVAFNAAEMLAEVVRSMSYSNRDKKQLRDVIVKPDFDLPDTLIYGDPVRLHQVLGNLIGNSLKFTEKGIITVGARKESETSEHINLSFWVKDTGIGIPASQIDKLFKPFSQADASTARKYGGSGLGLSICKALIESMMHGTIELESEENVGTTVRFSVTFPKADTHASAGDSQNSDQQDPMAKYIRNSDAKSLAPYPDFSKVPRASLRICIAEDNPVNQKIAIQIVQKLGFNHVDAYSNGMEAVEGLRRMAKAGTPYHLVLMDCQMPVLDGYESTRMIRVDELDAVRGVLVIAMTASAIQGDREKCLDSGMNDYLAKPVRVHVLKKKLEEYLHQPPAPSRNLSAEAIAVADSIMNEPLESPPSLSTAIQTAHDIDEDNLSPHSVPRGREREGNVPPSSADARSGSVV